MFIWLELPTKTCMNADFEEGCSNKRWTLIDRLKCVSNKRAAQLSRVAFIKCLVSCQHSLFIYWQPIRAECIFNNFFLFIVSRRVVFSRGVRSMLMECLTPRPKSHPKKGETHLKKPSTHTAILHKWKRAIWIKLDFYADSIARFSLQKTCLCQAFHYF